MLNLLTSTFTNICLKNTELVCHSEKMMGGVGELLGKFSLNISTTFCAENIKANTFLQTVGDVRLHFIPVTQKMQKDDKWKA